MEDRCHWTIYQADKGRALADHRYGPTGQNMGGSNPGCYQNPTLDLIIDRPNTAIDPTDQRSRYRDSVRVQTEQLPLLPLYFDVQMALFRAGVTGVKGDTKPTTSVAWNVAEWDAT
ncbi:MAG: hypothetical protein HW416_3058 [Chloroflexi bacterium]|nr:hypothetical protein [Chloroflexota bacterium]